MPSERTCPHCAAANLPDRRFCRACGTSLELRCGACGCVQEVGRAVCRACGVEIAGAGRWQPPPLDSALRRDGLSAEAILRAERRVATVVKADLSGFTAMSEKLGDPEEVTRIVNRVFEPLVDAVRRFGGYVDNYAGDMVIALFGLPEACELAAERAVRAALAMREEVERLNALDLAHGVELGISTGVATGPTLWGTVGFGAAAKRTISGELGGSAADLEKIAGRGEVSICAETFGCVYTSLVCEQRTELARPVGELGERPTYNALATRPPLAWADRHGDEAAPLCGHQAAWQGLQQAWREASAGAGQTVWLAGPPGAGKSRLLLELYRQAAADGARVHAVERHPLAEALGEGDVEASAPSAGDVPSLLVLDGVEPDGLPAGLLDLPHGRPCLVACASRTPPPDGCDKLLVVPALDRDAVAALAGHLLVEEPTPAQVEWLLRWSGGSPLAVRELSGAMPAGSQPPRTVPWRLRELCDARIDGLPAAERALLLALSGAAAEPEATVSLDVLSHLVDLGSLGAIAERLAANGAIRMGNGSMVVADALLWLCARGRLVETVQERLAGGVADAAMRVREGV